jgi:hypothetical protein
MQFSRKGAKAQRLILELIGYILKERVENLSYPIVLSSDSCNKANDKL